MDPDANTRERIALYRKVSETTAKEVDWYRLDELETAYSRWRSSGGFPADAALLAELMTVRQP